MTLRDEEQLRPRPVQISSEVAGQITALVPGPGSEIKDAWVEVAGKRVTKVPVGLKFDILVHYRAENDAPTPNWWSVCITVIGDGIRGYEDTHVSGADPTKGFGTYIEEYRMTLNKYRGKTISHIMPDGAGSLSLRIKLWLHDDYRVDPVYPPESEW